jgi:HK97 family phage portal protein
LSSDPNETQFIDLMRFEVEQVCRFWGVPPSMVYAAVSGQNVTYSNVTDADLAFLKHSLDGYLVRIENALTQLLPKPQVVRANRDAVLRSDARARHEIYDIRLKNRTVTVNEVRKLEDEPPFPEPEFDDPGIPGGEEKVPLTPVPPPVAMPGSPEKLAPAGVIDAPKGS